MDGFNVNQRLSELDYKFFVDSTVRTYSLMHGRTRLGRKKRYTWALSTTHRRRKKNGEWPKLEYLKVKC
jgi:hypothetical protein